MNQDQTKNKLNILIANGVNLDLLGRREPSIYGTTTLMDIEIELKTVVSSWSQMLNLPTCELDFFQTNSEDALLAKISLGWDGILLNSGAWTHTSLALADRLVGLSVPYVEVHLSNLSRREDFRKHSYTAAAALGVVYGFGPDSYVAGLLGLVRHLSRTLSSP